MQNILLPFIVYSSRLNEITLLHFAHRVGSYLGGFSNFLKLYSFVP